MVGGVDEDGVVPLPALFQEAHQVAQSLVNAGAARILFQKSLQPQEFYHSIMNLIHNRAELEKMAAASKTLGRPNATKEIVDQIFQAAA